MRAHLREPRLSGLERRAMTLAIRNGLWNGSSNVVGALTGIVGSIIVVRNLSTEAYGAFSYYIWLAGILVTLGTLAFPVAVTKITSELYGEQEYLEARALSRCVTFGLAGVNLFVSLGVVVWAFSSPLQDRTYLLVVAASVLPNALAAVMRSTLWGRERYRRVALVSTVASVLQLAVIVVVSRFAWGAPGFVAAVLFSTVVHAIGLAIALRPRDYAVHLPLSISLPGKMTVRRYLAFVVPSTLGLPIGAIVWERSEVFFLARYSGMEQIGFYNLAYTTFSLMLALGWALINGFYPSMSRDYGAGNWPEIQAKVRHAMILATLYAVPLTFGGLATIEVIIVLFYGERMLPAAPIARVLLVGLLPGVVSAVAGVMVSATGRIWLAFRVGIALCALNVGLDFILIPRSGALGGAIANTTTQVVFAVVLLIIVSRVYRIEFDWRNVINISIVGALTTYLLPRMAQAWLPGAGGLVSAILLGGGLYLVVTWLFGHLRIFLSSSEVPT